MNKLKVIFEFDGNTEEGREAAKWLEKMGKQQIAQPEERIGRLGMGIVIDQIRKAKAVTVEQSEA